MQKNININFIPLVLKLFIHLKIISCPYNMECIEIPLNVAELLLAIIQILHKQALSYQ